MYAPFTEEDWVKVAIDGTFRELGLKIHGDISGPDESGYHDMQLSRGKSMDPDDILVEMAVIRDKLLKKRDTNPSRDLSVAITEFETSMLWYANALQKERGEAAL